MTQTPSIKDYAEVILRAKEVQNRISDLHKLFTPNPGQLVMGQRVFQHKTFRNWLQFGRDSGKTFGASYCLSRFALTHDDSYSVVVYPERGQGQKTLWDSKYLENKIPQKYWLRQDYEAAFNKTELLVKLDNGSRIQIFGSDSPDHVLRGPKPDFCVFDEFRDFKSNVYDTMEANLIGKILLLISTPPDTEGFYTELQQMFIEAMETGDPDFFYLELPSYVARTEYAPGGVLHEQLMKLKARLIKRGEEAVWKREYEAKFVPGGAGAVFKKYQTNKEHIERSPSFLEALIRPKQHKLEWYCVADPSQNGCFAVLYIAVDRAASQFYVLAEDAVKENSLTGSLNMWKIMREKMMSLYPVRRRWKVVYDEAAAWFFNDLQRFCVTTDEDNIEKTQKYLRDKTEDMSMLKEIFSNKGWCFISRACEETIFQIENYVTNKKGEYHKDQADDFIDALRYFLGASSYQPVEVPDWEVEEDIEKEDPRSLRGLLAKRQRARDILTGDMNQVYSLSDLEGREAEEEGDFGDDRGEEGLFPFSDGEFY